MAQLSALVKAGHADIGFAHDADGERLGIVTELGERLSEELTIGVATRIRFDKVRVQSSQMSVPPAPSNKSPSAMGVPWCERRSDKTYISEAMFEHGAILGGEGSGGVTVPQVHLTHDSAAAVGLILEGLARSSEPVSEVVGQLPILFMLKHNIAVEPNHLYSVCSTSGWQSRVNNCLMI